MKVDNYIASKNYSSNLYESITKHNNSYKAAKNYADSAFKNDITHIQALSDEDKALKEQTDAFEAFLIKSVLDISLKQEILYLEKMQVMKFIHLCIMIL